MRATLNLKVNSAFSCAVLFILIFLVDLCRNLALSPKGESIDVPSSDMNDETFTLTLMTNLDPNCEFPFEIDLRVESNNQWDFLRYELN